MDGHEGTPCGGASQDAFDGGGQDATTDGTAQGGASHGTPDGGVRAETTGGASQGGVGAAVPVVIQPQAGYFRSPPPSGVEEGVPWMSDDILVETATENRRRALTRLHTCRWEMPRGFRDLMGEEVANVDGGLVCDVHGHPNQGRQGPQRVTYEVLAFCNEFFRYGPSLHAFHHRLYVWALLFPVPKTGTFEVAANNWCRLLRAWPKAVFGPRLLVHELSVPIVHDEGQEPYLEDLVHLSSGSPTAESDDNDNPPEEFLPSSQGRCAVRDGPLLRRVSEEATLTQRGLVPSPWCSGVARAPTSFQLGRWFPRVPRYCRFRPLDVETPMAVWYMAGALRHERSPLWPVFKT